MPIEVRRPTKAQFAAWLDDNGFPGMAEAVLGGEYRNAREVVGDIDRSQANVGEPEDEPIYDEARALAYLVRW